MAYAVTIGPYGVVWAGAMADSLMGVRVYTLSTYWGLALLKRYGAGIGGKREKGKKVGASTVRM